MRNFGEKLRKLRKQHDLTQKQLASLLHVQHSIISFYENGDRLPSPDVIKSIAAVFHVSADFLLDIEKGQVVDVSGLTDNQIEIVQSIIAEFRSSNSNEKEGDYL